MKTKRFPLILIAIFSSAIVCFGQQTKKPALPIAAPPNSLTQAIKSTAAYAEIILRKTELESILEDLLVTYTDDFPKVKETRYELGLIEKDSAKLLAAGSNSANLSPALGKLLVRRAALATDLWSLQGRYGDDHPDVKRARRRVSIFDKAVGEIFP